METLRMRCICLFAVTVMMIWGTAASKWCCMPAQWQGIEMMDIGTSTNCTPSLTKVSLQYITINAFDYGSVVITCVCYEWMHSGLEDFLMYIFCIYVMYSDDELAKINFRSIYINLYLGTDEDSKGLFHRAVERDHTWRIDCGCTLDFGGGGGGGVRLLHYTTGKHISGRWWVTTTLPTWMYFFRIHVHTRYINKIIFPSPCKWLCLRFLHLISALSFISCSTPLSPPW